MGLGLDGNDNKIIKVCQDDLSKISGQMPVITKFKKSISNAEEMLSRGGQVILLTDNDVTQRNGLTTITLPFEINENSCISLSVLFQLVSLNLSQRLGHNPDRPRNLAKCVTVE